MHRRQTIIGTLLVFAFGVLNGQNLIIKSTGVNDSVRSFPGNSAVLHVVQNNAVTSSSVAPKVFRERFIVELNAPSVLERRLSTIPLSVSATESPALVRQNILAVSPELRIQQEYTMVMSGFSVTADRRDLLKISKIAGVKKIHEDQSVESFQFTKTSAGKAGDKTKISSAAGTGKGIKVGVIDTGIDYLHEALGGGFGAGYKVIGGYDFINNTGTPMDDNGHGTHVAGIIAGNSAGFSGIAPDALLLAYKVLDNNGNGYVSTVIAGIEQAVRDSVRIINLSLGSSDGAPNDILCETIDRVVRAGVVVVAAAGNKGDFGTIGSPGAAKEAITVGATDSNYRIAPFSSKGPTQLTYGIKPDIVAPGVEILSAKLGGGYLRMTGTSMAAPFVAGWTALFCALHPDWEAVKIRDAVIESGRDIRQSIFAQGIGCLDTAADFTSKIVATPSSISFGFDPPSQSSWTKTGSFSVSNTSSKTVVVDLHAENVQSGMALRIQPLEATILPGQSATIFVELNVDNLQVKDNTSYAQGYTAAVMAVSGSDSLKIPIVFFKGNVFFLSFNETPWQVLIHDRKSKSYSFLPKCSSLTSIVPAGTYDVVTAFYGGAYVVRENINTASATPLHIDRSEAIDTMTLVPSDEWGTSLGAKGTTSTFSAMEVLLCRNSAFALVVTAGGAMTPAMDQQRYFSPASPAYAYGLSLNLQYGTATTYTFDAGIDSGFAASTVFRFGPSDLKPLAVHFEIDPAAKKIFPLTWSSFLYQGTLISVTYYDGNDDPLLPPFVQSAFYTAKSVSHIPFFHSREAYRY